MDPEVGADASADRQTRIAVVEILARLRLARADADRRASEWDLGGSFYR